MESRNFQLKKGELKLSDGKFSFNNTGEKVIKRWDAFSIFLIIFGIAFLIFAFMSKGVWIEFVLGTAFFVWGIFLIRKEIKKKNAMILDSELTVSEIVRAETTVDLGQDWLTVKVYNKAGNVKDFVLRNTRDAGKALVSFLQGHGINTVSKSY